MSASIDCFLITHGDLGKCLIRIVDKLVSSTIPISFFSNKDLSLDVIVEQILNKIAEQNCRNHLLLVDLVGGSCWMAANRVKQNNADIAVIGGVNVPMLVSFQINHQRLKWNDLLVKMVEDGKKGIAIR